MIKQLRLWQRCCGKNISLFGLSAWIYSDQGRAFDSKLLREVLTVAGIKKCHTTPYHLQGDPQLEQFNRTLLNMLGTLFQEQKVS